MVETKLMEERPANNNDPLGVPKVSPSLRGAWKQCQRKVFYRYVAGIEPKRPSNTARIIGSCFHRGLELWRKANHTQHPQAINDIIAVVLADVRAQLELAGFADKAVAEVMKMNAYLRGYFERYKEDAVRFAQKGDGKCRWQEVVLDGQHDMGVLDALFVDEETGVATIIEDKTRADLDDDRALSLAIDEQLLTYADMLRRAMVPFNQLRVLYRETCKTKLRQTQKETIEQYGTRVLLAYLDHTKHVDNYREITAWVDATEAANYALERQQLDVAIRGKLATSRSLVGYERNSAQCIGPYGACEYLQACVHHNTKQTCSSNYVPNNKQPLDGGLYRLAMFGQVQPQPAQNNTPTIEKEWWNE